MDPVSWLVQFVLHLDTELPDLISQYRGWVYVFLFLVVFCETGLVVFPFLPGDSLIFAAGALAATGSFDVWLLFVVFASAALLGDTVNYWIGHYFGPRLFKREDSRIFRKDYLNKAHTFYERHGAETIVLARFVPVIRTFAPFVAGMGEMNYRKFIIYNVSGGILWVSVFLSMGFLVGNQPFVQDNFGLVLIAMILISFVPMAVEVWMEWRRSRKGKAEGKV
ncbi:MAG: DedA family protein [Methanobacteriota archaeon]